MGYEVDVIGVGKESRSGDAIALRWGNLHGNRREQKVVLIDGGFQDSGQDVVNHIKRFYGTTSIDAVVSTHPDQDHVNGLHVVLDEMSVEQLWMHKPWEHNDGLAAKFMDGRVTDSSMGRRLQESLNMAADLAGKAQRKSIRIVEPFTGISLYDQNEFHVLGPTQHYYEGLIPAFRGMPTHTPPLSSLLVEVAPPRPTKSYRFTWGVDKLDDADPTTAENNSSAITLLAVDGSYLLFTADAGITALNHAADRLDVKAADAKLRFVQIPHHGSRRNLGPRILNRLIGPPIQEGDKRQLTAIASTAKKGAPKHPRKAVMNAFTHRGANALATRGKTIRHSRNAPRREGWSRVEPEKYHRSYEEDK